MTQPRLLLVDDSAEVALIVRHICGRAGMEIVAHADAEQAWAYLQTAQPDLVLLDVNLPGASGYDLCRWVRFAPALVDLPIALLSHWRHSEDVAMGLEAGTDFVLSKDLLGQPEEWKKRLREILDWCAGRRPELALPWKEVADARVLAEWLEVMVQGPVARKLGESVTRLLLLRAERLADVTATVRTAPALRDLLAWFVEELWCLLGTAETTAMLEALPAPRALAGSELP
jgi:DNA-binding response OmpR family regulator